MINILLNEFNTERCDLLRSKLEGQGYNVFSVNQLDGTISTIHDTDIDLMIFDLDRQNIESINKIVGRCKSVSVLFETSYPGVELDFRCWAADEIVYKSDDGKNVVEAVAQLLTGSTSK